MPLALSTAMLSWAAAEATLTNGSINQLGPDCCWVQTGSNNQCGHMVHLGESRPPGGQGNKQEKVMGSHLCLSMAKRQPRGRKKLAESQNK